MNIVFRADASFMIGSGHIMRCLTLANYLADKGHDIFFLSRKRPGNINSIIPGERIALLELQEMDDPDTPDEYESWLSLTPENDARECISILEQENIKADWLIVDHYGISQTWQRLMRQTASKIMSIDDLGIAKKDCDVLLDQNLDELIHQKHQNSCERHTRFLLGPEYALVDPGFQKLREKSLAKNRWPIRNILISMGGIDTHNDSLKVLQALKTVDTKDTHIDVVLGQKNKHKPEIKSFLTGFESSTLHIQSQRMAELICNADLAFLACGTTTWEKCILGVPSIVTIQAENQKNNAFQLKNMNAHVLAGMSQDVTVETYIKQYSLLNKNLMSKLSQNCARICDGKGLHRVIKSIEGAS